MTFIVSWSGKTNTMSVQTRGTLGEKDRLSSFGIARGCAIFRRNWGEFFFVVIGQNGGGNRVSYAASNQDLLEACIIQVVLPEGSHRVNCNLWKWYQTLVKVHLQYVHSHT